MIIILDKNLYGLKDAVLACFEKLKEGLEDRSFFQSQVDPFIWYKEEIILIFYIDDCLIFIPSKDKIDGLYDSLQAYCKIEDDVELNKYLGIKLERRLYSSIHMSQPYLTQRILNMIPVMYKSSARTTPMVKPPLAKKEGSQARKNDFNYRSVNGLLNFLTKFNSP